MQITWVGGDRERSLLLLFCSNIRLPTYLIETARNKTKIPAAKQNKTPPKKKFVQQLLLHPGRAHVQIPH
jgi:hypothetical protein